MNGECGVDMPVTINNTGERILLDKETPSMVARHFFAYQFAGGYAGSKNVLDIACGEGYGSDYLARKADYVAGVDSSAEAIVYAKEKYKNGNLEFYCHDGCKLEFKDSRFDLICSFQTIEHIFQAGEFLGQIRRILKSPGTFIITTPNIKDSSPNSIRPLNKYHLKEYTYDEFKRLLKEYFPDVEIYGLRRTRKHNFFRRLKKSGILNAIPHTFNPVDRFFKNVTWRDFFISKEDMENCLDFLAVCRK